MVSSRAKGVASRTLLALFASALLGLGASACGGAKLASHVSSGSGASDSEKASTDTSTNFTKVDSDKDNDIEAPYDDRSNASELDAGHAASTSEKRTITALIRNYYAAAFADDGAKACSMIYSTLAEAIPEDYSLPPGPIYMRAAKTCPTAMTLLFKHFHTRLAIQVPILEVKRVRLIEHHGFVLLGFGSMPERKLSVEREGHTWKIDGLLDSELS